MDQPFKLNIELLKQKDYLHTNLDGKTLNLSRRIIKGDYVPISRWSELACVSDKFRNIFEEKLKGHWYPTNHKKYFIFLLNNTIDGLNMEKSFIINHQS